MKGIARMLGTVALGLALLAAAARAQSQSSAQPSTRVTWNVGVGPSFPHTSGFHNRGFNVRVGGTFPLTDKPVWIRLGLGLDNFVSRHLFPLEADLGYTFKTAGAFGSYLFGGPQSTGTNTRGVSGWGANVGGGLTFPLANRIGYLEVRYVWSGVWGFEMIPITFGIRF